MAKLYPKFSEREFERRYDLVRRMMESLNLRALVIYGDSGNNRRNQANIYYLSNYMDRHLSYLVFPFNGDPVLFVGLYNHLPNAKALSIIKDTMWGGERPARAVSNTLRKLGFEQARIGLVGPGGLRGILPHDHYMTLREQLPLVKMMDVSEQFRSLRLVKSAEELEWLRRGAQFTDAAIGALAKKIKPGMREYELSFIITKACTDFEAELHFFYVSTTSMKAPTRFVPWQYPSNRTIRKGDVILTEISAAYWGYTGQIHRPIAVGKEPTRNFRDLFNIAYEAYSRIASTIRPGATEKDVVKAASIIEDKGLMICDSLVHGFGVDLLPPTIGLPDSAYWPPKPFSFRQNMAVVIQPNPILRDKPLGVQLGNLCAVKESGAQSLQKYPMEFIVSP